MRPEARPRFRGGSIELGRAGAVNAASRRTIAVAGARSARFLTAGSACVAAARGSTAGAGRRTTRRGAPPAAGAPHVRVRDRPPTSPPFDESARRHRPPTSRPPTSRPPTSRPPTSRRPKKPTAPARAGIAAPAFDHVLAAAPLGTRGDFVGLLGQHSEKRLTRLDAIVEVVGLRAAADAHASAVLDAALLLVVVIIPVFLFILVFRAVRPFLAVFDLTACRREAERQAEQAPNHDHFGHAHPPCERLVAQKVRVPATRALACPRVSEPFNRRCACRFLGPHAKKSASSLNETTGTGNQRPSVDARRKVPLRRPLNARRFARACRPCRARIRNAGPGRDFPRSPPCRRPRRRGCRSHRA